MSKPPAAATCRYCGAGVMFGSVCRACQPLEEADPHAIAALGPISEAELGVRPPWPEGELQDDGTGE